MESSSIAYDSYGNVKGEIPLQGKVQQWPADLTILVYLLGD